MFARRAHSIPLPFCVFPFPFPCTLPEQFQLCLLADNCLWRLSLRLAIKCCAKSMRFYATISNKSTLGPGPKPVRCVCVCVGKGKGDLCDGEHNPLAVGIVCICRLCLRPLKGFNCAFCLPVDIGKVVPSPHSLGPHSSVYVAICLAPTVV